MDVINFWKDVLAQDRDAIRSYFHKDAYVNWHCTNEHFTLEEFIHANCDYPGVWAGEVQRIEQQNNLIITATKVYPEDKTVSFHVVSFIRLEDNKIISIDEYWGDDGAPPIWRQEMNIGRPIARI